jgi:hypothetical protein
MWTLQLGNSWQLGLQLSLLPFVASLLVLLCLRRTVRQTQLRAYPKGLERRKTAFLSLKVL